MPIRLPAPSTPWFKRSSLIQASKGPCNQGMLPLFRSAMPNTSHSSLLEKTIERFLFHSQYEKNLSGKTLKAYATDLRQFADFMMEERSISSLPSISPDDLKQYVKSLSRFQPKTMKRKMATLKAMLNFIEMEDDDFINPMRKLKINIKVPFLLPPVMDSMEVASMLTTLYREKNTCSDKTGHRYQEIIRNIAVVELLFGTGIRVSELCALHLASVNLHHGFIKVYGKGGKERVIQICQDAILEALHEYQRLCLPSSWQNTFFFINRLGRNLTSQSVRIMIKKLAMKSGILKPVTPHTFRHTFATLLLEEGVDIKYIQTILGHSSLATTQIYTHVSAAKQRVILQDFHPRKNMQVILQ